MKIAVIQLTSFLDFNMNLKIIKHCLQEAKKSGAVAAFLPECFYSLSDGQKATPHLVDPISKNEHYKNIQNLAVDSGIYVLGGSAASFIDGKILNRNYNFDPQGNELSHYDKMHLFSVDLSRHESKKVLDEAKIYTPGSVQQIVEFADWKVGASICFDLRFPEMYRRYRKDGAEILSISSAFTVPTGVAHWHTLVRARAIENQCYVVAAAQWGFHNERIQTYGHSLVVGPWGDILVDAREGVGVFFAEISKDHLSEVRSRLQVPTDNL